MRRSKLGAKNPNWGGGLKLVARYIKVYAPKRPDADCKGYVFEHRIVAEKTLGRPLRREEVVHHKDGNPANNDPENLEVYPSHREHMKQHADSNYLNSGKLGKAKRLLRSIRPMIHYAFCLDGKCDRLCLDIGSLLKEVGD